MADLDKPYKITERVNDILEKTLNTVEPKFVKQVVEWVGSFRHHLVILQGLNQIKIG